MLIEYDRAGNPRYKNKLIRKIKSLQDQSQKIGKRVPRSKELTDEQKAIYYSSWLYTGIRNLSAIQTFHNVNEISRHLNCDLQVVARVVRFLLDNGLCKEENGKLTFGPASIHVDKESPFVNKHHQNWRFQAIHHMELRKDSDLFFSSPMSLSKQAYNEIRKDIPNYIQSIMKISGPSESEQVACLNIDWFQY